MTLQEAPPGPEASPGTDPTAGADRTSGLAGSPSGEAPADRWSRRRLGAVLAFPVLVSLAFALMVTAGWNGSSSGLLRERVEGPAEQGNPPGHVYGAPNPIRSDEWAVITPLIVGQDANGYAQVDSRAFGGTDVSVFSGLPYRGWSTLFRPQHWGFFVLGFEQAVAFHWWFPAWLLAVGSYALVLGICRRPAMAAAAALAIGFAPFVHWWFLTITVGSLAWASVLVGLYIAWDHVDQLRLGRPWRRVAQAACLAGIAYATAAFLLLLYPAFQIPCAWVAGACVVGWTFRAGAPASLHRRLHRLAWAGAAGAAGAAIFVLFVATRWDVVHVQAGTEYPGGRSVPSGQGDSVWLFSGFLDRYLRPGMALPAPLGGNSSEASSFVLVGVFLTIPAVWLLVRGWRQRIGVDGLVVALLAVEGLFLAFLFVPGLGLLAKATLLSQVLPQRLSIGLGLLSLVLTVAVIREMRRQRVRPPWAVVALAGAVALAVHIRTGLRVQELAPEWSGGAGRWLLLALAVTALVIVAATGYGTLTLSLLAVVSFAAAYQVNPVSSGVYDARASALGEAIVEVNEADPGGWVALGSHLNSAVLAMLPIERYSGTALYPAFDMWEDLDPTGEQRPVYNRYAHVVFTDDPDAPAMVAPTPDTVVARFDGCSRFAQNRLRHVLSDEPTDDPCLRLTRKVTTGHKTYYLYAVVPAESRLR